jgi:hypothetical protein
MFRKKRLFVFAGLCLAVVFVGLFFVIYPNAQTTVQRIYQKVFAFNSKVEYCAITRVYAQSPPLERLDLFIGYVEITYFERRYDNTISKNYYSKKITVSEELVYGDFMQTSSVPGSKPQDIENRKAASARAIDLAMSKAMVELGEQGWEMVGSSFRTYNFENFENGKAVSTTEIRNDSELGTPSPLIEPKLKNPVYFKRLKYSGSYQN